MNRSWSYNPRVPIKILLKIFVLLVCLPGFISAQQHTTLSNLRFDHLNFSNGLSFNIATSIIKDKQGFIWIATLDGLNRYDGVNFKIYRHDVRNPNSPASNSINTMTLDRDGNIWMATDAALTEYIPTTGSFKNFFVTTTSKAVWTRSPYVDLHNIVWFGDNDGLCRLNADGKIETFPIKHLLQRFSIGSIIEDDEGVIWIGTIQGLYGFDKQTHIFKRYFFYTGSKDESSVTCIIQDHEKNIWVGSWGGSIAKFDRQTGNFEAYKDAGNYGGVVLSICESPYQTDKLWIGTEDEGAALFDKKKKSFEFVSIDPGNIYAFNSYSVKQIFDDHLGTLWFAGSNGVIKLDKYKQQFQRQVVEPLTKVSYKGITGIIVDTQSSQKLLWISTYLHGLICYIPQTNKFTIFDPNPGNAINNEFTNSIVFDVHRKLWIATSNGLKRFDPATKTFVVYKNILRKNSLPGNDVNHLMFSKEGKLWMSIRGNGFCCFDPETKYSKWYRQISDQNNDSINNAVFCLTEDHAGNIWGGTQFGGMFRFNPKTEKFFIYNLKNHFINQTVYDILESQDQTIWIASENGLWHLNPVSDLLKQYTTADGLPNDDCQAIKQDRQQRLWIATLNGLSLFDKKKNHFENYTANDGLIDNEVGSFNKGDDGKFYIGYADSYNYFDPDNIIKNNVPPPIAFTSFKIFGEETSLPENNTANTPLQLNYRQNMLSFEFAALNYTVPQKNQYVYKLEGADKNWTFSGSGRQATYSNLSGGNYVFHIKASNNDGVWNETGRSIFIHIAPPFWRAWWFKTLVIITIIFSVYLFYRRRIAFIRKEEEKKTSFNKQLVQIEMKALKAQMNPHFIFNCMNSINSYILENNKKKASDYLTKFSTLIRLILENSDKQKINLADELAMLETYLQLEQNRLDNKFDYHIEVDASIKTIAFEIPPLILQPFIENAIWHGLIHKTERGKININILKEPGRLICIIEDNGIGRTKAALLKEQKVIKYQSMGMKVTEDRLRILNRLNLERPSVNITDLFTETNEPSGTRVEITIPI
jgi:ligand-binding sensor domain-containing protein